MSKRLISQPSVRTFRILCILKTSGTIKATKDKFLTYDDAIKASQEIIYGWSNLSAIVVEDRAYVENAN